MPSLEMGGMPEHACIGPCLMRAVKCHATEMSQTVKLSPTMLWHAGRTGHLEYPVFPLNVSAWTVCASWSSARTCVTLVEKV